MDSFELFFHTSDTIQIVDISLCDHIISNDSYSFYHFHSFSPKLLYDNPSFHPFYSFLDYDFYRFSLLESYSPKPNLFTKSFNCMVIKLSHNSFYNVWIIRMERDEFNQLRTKLRKLIEEIELYPDEHKYFIIKEVIMKEEYSR